MKLTELKKLMTKKDKQDLNKIVATMYDGRQFMAEIVRLLRKGPGNLTRNELKTIKHFMAEGTNITIRIEQLEDILATLLAKYNVSYNDFMMANPDIDSGTMETVDGKLWGDVSNDPEVIAKINEQRLSEGRAPLGTTLQ